MTHIHDCLDQLKSVPDSICRDRQAIELALWFHDVIYDPTRTDNESASAEFAEECLEKMDVEFHQIQCIKELIKITDHRSEPKTPDEILIVDIDLSILGREPEPYSTYAKAIRDEYAHVEESDYQKGRALVLKDFLSRTRIFRTEYFYERYETLARRNIEAEISSLS